MICNKKPNFSRAGNLDNTEQRWTFFSLLVFGLLCFWPELSWADDSLQSQLEVANKLMSGTVRPLFLTGALVLATGFLVYTGNLLKGASMVLLLVVIAFVLQWIEAGMRIGAQVGVG